MNKRALNIWDEGIYSAAASNVLFDGNWLVPHLYRNVPNYIPFYDKPPLFLWLQSISIGIFGNTPFSARLPSAIAAIMTALICYRIGEQLFSRRVGIIAGLVFLVLPPVIGSSHSGLTGTTDTMLILFGSLFVYWTYQYSYGKMPIQYAVVAGVLTVMTKGVAAGVFLLVILPILVLRYRQFLKRTVVGWGGLGIILLLIWPISAYIKYGEAFIAQFLGNQVLRRVTTESTAPPVQPLIPGFDYPYFVYGVEIAFGIIFATVFALSLITALFQFRRKQETKYWFFVWWLVAIPLTFGFLGGEKIWYIYPMAVPGALLTGHFLSEVISQAERFTPKIFDLDDISIFALGLVAVVVIASIYLPPVSTGASGQQELSNAIEDVPEDEIIYIDQSLLEFPSEVYWYPLDFYTEDREISSTAEGDSKMEYAVLKQRNVDDYGRYATLDTVSIKTFNSTSNQQTEKVVLVRLK